MVNKYIESVRENMGIANVYLTSKENYMTYAEYEAYTEATKTFETAKALGDEEAGGMDDMLVGQAQNGFYASVKTVNADMIIFAVL